MYRLPQSDYLIFSEVTIFSCAQVTLGCAVAQVIRRWFLTTEPQVES
jgi:hypothetical protein